MWSLVYATDDIINLWCNGVLILCCQKNWVAINVLCFDEWTQVITVVLCDQIKAICG